MRNHNTLSRAVIIEELAKCVPPEHKVNLEDPELFILVEIWKVRRSANSVDFHWVPVFEVEETLIGRLQSVCGIGIVRDYYKLQKFNVMEIAKGEEPGFKAGTGGRVGESSREDGKKAGEEKEETVSELVSELVSSVQ